MRQNAAFLQKKAWEILFETPPGHPDRQAALETALVYFQKAATQAPHIGEYRLNAARIYHDLGLKEKAFKEALKAFPTCDSKSPLPSTLVGQYAMALSRWDIAEAYLMKANQLNPNNSDILVNLARVLQKLNRPQDSFIYWKSRLELTPISDPIKIEASHSAFLSQQYAEVVKILSPLHHEGKVSGNDLVILAISHLRLGNQNQAQKILSEYWNQTPTPKAFPSLTELGIKEEDNFPEDEYRALQNSVSAGG